MKKTILELKEERTIAVEALDLHLAQFDGVDAPDYTEEEERTSQDLEAKVVAIDKEIAKFERLEEQKKRSIDRRMAIEAKGSPEEQVVRRFSFLKMIRSQIHNDTSLYIPLDGVEKEMHEEATREGKAIDRDVQGVAVPSFFFQPTRALSAGTATAGQETVQTDVLGLIGFLAPRLVTEELGVQVMTGLQGNVQFPRNDAQGAGAWEGEVDLGTEIDPTFDTVTMAPHRFGGFTIWSKQLLRQSSIGVENFARNNIASLLGQAVDTAYINGATGGNDPDGLLSLAGIGDVDNGANGGVPTWAGVVELETDVASANADFGNLAYLTTPGIRGLFKTTLKDTGVAGHIWQDPQGTPRMPGEGIMNGYRAVVSTLVPSNLTDGTGTGLHAVIFGNWADSAIGQWGGIDFVVDPYSLVRNAQIQIVANIWVDVAFFHAGSFSAMQDAALS